MTDVYGVYGVRAKPFSYEYTIGMGGLLPPDASFVSPPYTPYTLVRLDSISAAIGEVATGEKRETS